MGESSVPSTCRSISVKDQLQIWRRVSVLLIVINLLLIPTMVVIVRVWYTQRQSYTPIPHSPAQCSPVTNAGISDVCKNQTLIEENDIQFCCSKETLADSLKSWLDRVYEKQEVLGEAHDDHCIPVEDRPVGRVVGLTTDSSSSLLQWNVTSAEFFVHNITYISGRFVIRVVGYYYTYSQVTFVEDQKGQNKTPLIHSMYRQNQFSKTKLLESNLSACQLQTGSSNSTSYMGSVFYMNAGDELLVEVTDHTRLHNSPNSHFFGLHRI